MWFLPLKQNHPLDTQGTLRPPTYFNSNNQFSLEWNNLVNDGAMILILTLGRRNQVRRFQKGKWWKFSVDIWACCHWIISLWPEIVLGTSAISRLLPLMPRWSPDFQVSWHSESTWTHWRKHSTALFSFLTRSPWFVYTLAITVIWLSNYFPLITVHVAMIWRQQESEHSVLSSVYSQTIILRLPLETIAE